MLKKLFNFKNSILYKLLISYLLLIVLPVSLIGLFSFTSSQNIIDDQISKANNNMLTQIEININSLLDQITAIVDIYDLNTDLHQLLKKEYTHQNERIKDIERIEDNMSSYTYAFNWLKQQSILLGVNGIVYTSNREKSIINFNNINDYFWYGETLKNPERICWASTHKSFIKKQEYINTFTAVKILQNKTDKSSYGVLLLDINESVLYDIYKESLNNNNNQIFITDAKGNIISHSQRDKVCSVVDSVKYYKFMSDKSNDNNVITIDNKKYFCQYKKLDKVDWYIFQLIPMSAISKDSELLKIRILLIASICMAVSFIVAVIISRKISKPLINLSRRISNINTDNYLKKSRISLADEITTLSTEYDNMLIKLEDTIHELLKQQEEKRKAELKTLQMQINPHFLYNTLNSIKCLVWTGRVSLIESTINALVTLLQQTISRNDEQITIEDEVNNIINYVYIQEIRTCNTIKLEINIEDNLKKCKIPKLLLQPIIENAIFHGIEPREGEGIITINFVQSGVDIEIVIKDNGIGIDVDAISSILAGNHVYKHNFSGIGIKNVDERLKLYFGEKYGLEIESTLGTGTNVKILLPKIL